MSLVDVEQLRELAELEFAEREFLTLARARLKMPAEEGA